MLRDFIQKATKQNLQKKMLSAEGEEGLNSKEQEENIIIKEKLLKEIKTEKHTKNDYTKIEKEELIRVNYYFLQFLLPIFHFVYHKND